MLNPAPCRQKQAHTAIPEHAPLLAKEPGRLHMLADGIGNRHVKASVRERQRGRVALPIRLARVPFACVVDKRVVAIQPDHLRWRIPALQRAAQRTGSAADFQNARALFKAKKLRIRVLKAVGKAQLPRAIQRSNALNSIRPEMIHTSPPPPFSSKSTIPCPRRLVNGFSR